MITTCIIWVKYENYKLLVLVHYWLGWIYILSAWRESKILDELAARAEVDFLSPSQWKLLGNFC
jgi:hypothetical protein